MIDNHGPSPLVSVVLPTYNRSHLVPHAIRSVLGQTYQNLELIVVDDNSNDGTESVVKTFVDERLHYVKNEENLKLPHTLNRGFSLAQGSFLTWSSDDNLFRENAIEKMVHCLQSQQCDFVYADYFDFFELEETTGTPINPVTEHLPSEVSLERGNRIGACFLYTRKVYEEVGEYTPDLFLVEDYDYFIRIWKRFNMCHIPEPLYYFRRFEESLFWARFHEIKSADVLVRYMNGILDRQRALKALVTSILLNPSGIKSPAMRIGFQKTRNSHWRVSSGVRKLVEHTIERNLSDCVFGVLQEFDAGEKSFAEAKDALSQCIRTVAELAYAR